MRIFYSLGRFAYRYRWFVVLFWGTLLMAGSFFAPNLSDRLKGGFGGADSEAERVQDIMLEEFDVSPSSLVVVFEGDGLSAESPEFLEAQDAALDEVREIEVVDGILSYSGTNDSRFLSESGESSYALVSFDVPPDEAQDAVNEVRGQVRNEELTTYVTGAPAIYLDIAEASNEDIRQAEKYAFPLALVILVIAFGSLVAAGIPVLIGGASVVVALASLYFLAGAYDMSVFVLAISTMLCLGLGIDYALFAVSRFREELEVRSVPEAVARTVETAGRSIFFSGTAVLIGLMGLLFFPYMFMRSIGVAGALVVFVSVSAALTLLPAVLGILGPNVNALSVRRHRGNRPTGAGFWDGSARFVMRRPILVLVVVGALLFALLYPAMHMIVGVPEASVLPEEYESRAGDDILKDDFDYASLNPIEVVATLPDDPTTTEGLAAIQDLGESVGETEGVARVESVYTIGAEGAREYAEAVTLARSGAEDAVRQQLDGLRVQYGFVPPGAEQSLRAEAEEQVPELPEGISSDGSVTPEGVANFLALPEAQESEEVQNAVSSYTAEDRALVRATPEGSPYTAEARDTVGEVRAVEAPEGTSFLVGGLPAGQRDFISNLYGNAPFAVAFVLGVTYLVLFFTFRSVFIPLKAVIVNILSLTASFGAMVFVFQDGNLSGLLGFTPLGFVDATLPILMFCTIFGVSMDYEVFLLSRIREAYEEGESNTASVARGLVSTAGIITSAAAIIVVVTGAFAFTGIITTKALGLGLAVAVLVDATIIRVLLVPATMRVLGDWNWWPGGRKSNVFKAQGAAQRSPQGEMISGNGQHRDEGARHAVRRVDQEATENGYPRGDTRQEGRGAGYPERRTTRRGRNRSFLSPDREMPHVTESFDGERSETESFDSERFETESPANRPGRWSTTARPGMAHLSRLFRPEREARAEAGENGERVRQEPNGGFPERSLRERRDREP